MKKVKTQEEEDASWERSMKITRAKEVKMVIKVTVKCPHCGKILNFNLKKYQSRNFPMCSNKECLRLIDIMISRTI
jgi:hypothetical protein